MDPTAKVEGLRTKICLTDLSAVLPPDQFTALHQLAGCGTPEVRYKGQRTSAGTAGSDGLEEIVELIVRKCPGTGAIGHPPAESQPYFMIGTTAFTVPPNQRCWGSG